VGYSVIKRPIFILGAHKSGTSLVRSLLDGHPDLFAIPFESHYFEYTGRWIINDFRYQQPFSLPDDEQVDYFLNKIKRLNRVEDKLGGSFARGKIDVLRFGKVIRRLPHTESTQERISLYFRAIYRSITGEKLNSDLRFVEKSVENVEFAWELSYLFPNASFIHIVRNPYANMVSLRKYKSRDLGFPIIRRVVNTLQSSFYYLYKNEKIVPNYLVIKYEELVKHPESVLRQICEKVDLRFQKQLLQPTVLGEIWESNTSTGESSTTLTEKYSDKWISDISPMEIWYINNVLGHVFEKFDYEQIPYEGSFWKPVSGESIFRYAVNRLYRFILQPTIDNKP